VPAPDLNDPRYADEVGWFLYHEWYGRTRLGQAFSDEQQQFSRAILDEVLSFAGRTAEWLRDKTVASIGCGCTGDLATWPTAAKVGIDPLVGVYERLGMLADDAPGTSPTIYIEASAERLPLPDARVDVAIVRNALDHMERPDRAVDELARVGADESLLFVSVDIGGPPTPDEPTVFTPESLRGVLETRFEIVAWLDGRKPHSQHRVESVRVLARRRPGGRVALDREELLAAYVARLREQGSILDADDAPA
jgi:SAM-dependent methyltransferase